MSDYLGVSNVSYMVGAKKILDSVDFKVSKGEILGIIGPNGAGKTTLLRCIAQLNRHYSGSIYLDSHLIQNLSKKQLAKKVAMVAQNSLPIFSLNVLDVVRMGLIPHKSIFATDTSNDRDTIENALEKVGLAHYRYNQFGNLSGGEQQRALIARALVQGAKILLMDEPTNHLDVFYQHQIMQLVKQLDVTVLTTVHDLNLASTYCQRLMLMANGRLVADGAPSEVLDANLLTRIFGLKCVSQTDPLNGTPRVSFYLEDV